MKTSRFKVAPGAPVSLRDHDPRATDGTEKEAGLARLAELRSRLQGLQELLYADGRHKVLVVLQGMDACGKDGTIRSVFEGVNPQGVEVVSFKKPTDIELAHDYLWRVHAHTPRAGQMTIFNRSHYEDVLIVRVHGLVPKARWSKRYDHIRALEQLLVDEGTTVLKFFLHLSKDEQRVRQQERIDTPSKQWKFSSADLNERKRWDDYRRAYEDVLSRTSTKTAPWYVVPADRNWFRNLVVSEVLVETLEGLGLRYPPPEAGIDKIVID